MNFSIFTHLLTTERVRPRSSSGAGYAVPAMAERGVANGLDPILVTNARRGFVVTKRNREGMARFGFSPCTLEEEPLVLNSLVSCIVSLSVASGWGNLFDSVGGAVDFMQRSRFKPKNLILPKGVTNKFTDSDGIQLGGVNGLQLLSAELPGKTAILMTEASALGVYVRVGDYVGLQLYNVDKTMVVIESHELG